MVKPCKLVDDHLVGCNYIMEKGYMKWNTQRTENKTESWTASTFLMNLNFDFDI